MEKVKALWAIAKLNVPIKAKIRLIAAAAQARRNMGRVAKKLKALCDGSYAATAQGDYLDMVGLLRGLSRRAEETDDAYRSRIRRAILKGEVFRE